MKEMSLAAALSGRATELQNVQDPERENGVPELVIPDYWEMHKVRRRMENMWEVRPQSVLPGVSLSFMVDSISHGYLDFVEVCRDNLYKDTNGERTINPSFFRAGLLAAVKFGRKDAAEFLLEWYKLEKNKYECFEDGLSLGEILLEGAYSRFCNKETFVFIFDLIPKYYKTRAMYEEIIIAAIFAPNYEILNYMMEHFSYWKNFGSNSNNRMNSNTVKKAMILAVVLNHSSGLKTALAGHCATRFLQNRVTFQQIHLFEGSREDLNFYSHACDSFKRFLLTAQKLRQNVMDNRGFLYHRLVSEDFISFFKELLRVGLDSIQYSAYHFYKYKSMHLHETKITPEMKGEMKARDGEDWCKENFFGHDDEVFLEEIE